MFNRTEQRNIESIKRIISTGLSERLSEFPQVLNVYLRTNAILTGGAIASRFNAQVPNDYDLYLNATDHIMFFRQYVTTMDQSLIKDANEKYMDVEVGGKLITANATTFKNGIQVITMHTADARNTFDFVHCMPWYEISKDLLHISKRQYDAIIKKTLIKNDHSNAVHLSQKRVEKYTDRGWRFK